jgi:hypothetical protein
VYDFDLVSSAFIAMLSAMGDRAHWVGLIAFMVAAAVTGCGDPNESGKVRASRVGALSDVPAPRAAFDEELTASCGPAGTATGVGPSELMRFPYVQRVSATSAALLWTASSPEPYTVQLTLPGGQQVASLRSTRDGGAQPADGYQHQAELSGLEPGSVYCYSIAGSDGTMAGPIGFRTAPAPGSDARVAFVAFGDSGHDGPDQDAVLAQMLNVPFDFALGTGDMAYDTGTPAQFDREFFAPYEPLLQSVPVFAIAGNHDYHTRSGAPFREVFALPENGGPEGRERWYSFDWGPVHVVGLDRQQLGDAQAQWLTADLAANELPWTIVFTHQSPYASGAHGSSMAFRERFVPILEQHRVALVLAGHDHDYERTEPINGVTYVVTGGGGRGTRPVGASSFTAFSVDVLHFVYVRIEGRELRLYAIDATGQEFDFARIEQPSRA